MFCYYFIFVLFWILLIFINFIIDMKHIKLITDYLRNVENIEKDAWYNLKNYKNFFFTAAIRLSEFTLFIYFTYF